MLVLSRKTNQALHIGKDIVVRVLGISGGQVKLGFDAPKETLILRDELMQADDDYAVRVRDE